MGTATTALLVPYDCHDPDYPLLQDEASEMTSLIVGETYHLDIFHAERKTEMSKFFITTSLDLSSSQLSTPTIAVYAHRTKHNPDVSVVATSTVNWLHSGGANVVVITSSMSEDEIATIIAGSQGLVIPGGTWAFATIEWSKKMEFIMEKVAEANTNTNTNLDDDGSITTNIYPVWATCTGFEFLLNATVAQEIPAVPGSSQLDELLNGGSLTAVLSKDYDAINADTALTFVEPAASESALLHSIFNDAPLVTALASQPATFANKHWLGITPDAFAATPSLASKFDILSTSVDRNGVPFVSTIEGKSMPFYGTQWHPEMAGTSMVSAGGGGGGGENARARVRGAREKRTHKRRSE